MSIHALQSFRLPFTVLLLLLILLMEEMMTMITVATMILLIQLILPGPALKARPVLLAKALRVEVVVVEEAAEVMVARQAPTPDPNERLFIQTLTLFRDAVDIWNRHTSAPRSTKSNLRNPDTFDGSDPAKLNPFLTQCYLHFAERTQDFPTDDDKILFMISYLRGTAQQWFAPNLYDPTAVPAWDGNFPVFVQELTVNFGLHDPVGDAEDRIRLCRMKHGDRIATYVIEFDQLALLTQWGDPALRHQFYEGLCQDKPWVDLAVAGQRITRPGR
jgi:hypothetical protein